jgi:hypothetical protein
MSDVFEFGPDLSEILIQRYLKNEAGSMGDEHA